VWRQWRLRGKSLEVCLTSQNEPRRRANIQIEIGVDWCPQKSTWRRFGGSLSDHSSLDGAPLTPCTHVVTSPHASELRPSERGFAMKPEELIEDEIILDFTISDEALEHAAAETIFSLGNCTEARTCQVPNEPVTALLKEQEWPDWYEVASFAAGCCQYQALQLKPWQEPPCQCDEDDPNERDRQGQALLRKMLAAGVSRYDPDPLAALAKKTKG